MVRTWNEVELSRNVGLYLKNQLKERKITQEEFAESVNVDPRTVRRWIGYGVHSLDVLVLIATSLDVDLRDVLSA